MFVCLIRSNIRLAIEAIGDKVYSNEHFTSVERKLLQIKDRKECLLPHHLHLVSLLLGSFLGDRKAKTGLFKDSDFKDQHYTLMEDFLKHVSTLGLMHRFKGMSSCSNLKKVTFGDIISQACDFSGLWYRGLQMDLTKKSQVCLLSDQGR